MKIITVMIFRGSEACFDAFAEGLEFRDQIRKGGRLFRVELGGDFGNERFVLHTVNVARQSRGAMVKL